MRLVADTGDLERATGRHDPPDGHFIARQRAGLVGTDHRDRAERLHGRQPADDRIALGHAAHANGQRDGQDGRQALRDRRDGDPDDDHEGFVGAITARQVRERVHGRRDQHDDDGQLPREAIHLPEQRRFELLDFAEHRADAAELGRRPGTDRDAHALSGRDQRPRECHRGAIAQRGLWGDRGDRFVDGDGLAGEHRFLDAEIAQLDQPQVGGHAIAGLEDHEIAGHDVLGRDRDAPPVPQHGSAWVDHAANRRECLLGAPLLDEPDHRVQHHDAQDHHGIDAVAEPRGHHRGCQQHVDQQVVELEQEPFQRAAPGGLRQAIRTAQDLASRSLARSETLGRRFECSEHAANVACVPGIEGPAESSRRICHERAPLGHRSVNARVDTGHDGEFSGLSTPRVFEMIMGHSWA